jgi:hypothetical protein
MKGMKVRMGQDWWPNKGMSTQLFLRVLESVQELIEGAPSSRDLNRWVVLHAYAVVSYVVSLRGREGLLLAFIDIGLQEIVPMLPLRCKAQ